MGEDAKPLMDGYLEIEIKNKDGEVVEKYRQKLHSWVRNFAHALRGILCCNTCDPCETVIDVNGNSYPYPRTFAQSVPVLRVDEAAGSIKKGIVFGTGTTPASPDDYKLESPIPHGTSSGQLNYKECTVRGVEEITNGARITIVRMATNESGGDITVSEVGLIAEASNLQANGNIYFLILREVLSEPRTVPNGDIIVCKIILDLLV